MELLPLTLIAPKIQASEIFPALELIMSHQAITEAIAETNSQEKRHRLLPTHLIIALIIALNFWSKDSIVDVLKNLVQGLSCSWIPKGFRSKKPKLVVQEIYGWLLAHWAIRSLIFRASSTTEQSPLQFSFTGTLRILRRAISQFQQALPSSLPYFFSWLISEIAEQIIPTRQGRTNPRVVKKPRSKFRARKPVHRTGFTQLQPLTFAVASSTM